MLYSLKQHCELYLVHCFVFSSMLEKNLRQLMECVDDVAMDTNKYLNFQRNNFKQQQMKQQYLMKRVGYFWPLLSSLGGLTWVPSLTPPREHW